MELRLSATGLRPVSAPLDLYTVGTGCSSSLLDSVHFPGAVDSKFTTKLSFERPSTHPAIPTYRFMDSDGVVVDEGRDPGVTDEEVLTWYKNMLTGMHLSSRRRIRNTDVPGIFPAQSA